MTWACQGHPYVSPVLSLNPVVAHLTCLDRDSARALALAAFTRARALRTCNRQYGHPTKQWLGLREMVHWTWKNHGSPHKSSEKPMGKTVRMFPLTQSKLMKGMSGLVMIHDIHGSMKPYQ